MLLLKKHGIILFWILLFLDCFFIYNQNYSYHGYLKGSLIPVLMLYIFLNARKRHYLVSKSLVFMGLLFAWIGDLLMLHEGNGFLIWGMLAFFFTHVFYIVFFFRMQPLHVLKATEATIAAVILITVGYQLNKFLQPEISQLPTLKVMLLAYSVAISIMAILATNVLSNKTKKPMALGYFMPGAALFIFADIIFLVSKFKYPDENYLHVIVMMSYGYGQCLLAQGFSKHLKG